MATRIMKLYAYKVLPYARTLPDSQRRPNPLKVSLDTRTKLLLLLLIAVILRVSWLFTHAFAIENEGAEYARLAENLLDGLQYYGVIENEGLQLNFPPLYPLLIAVTSLLVGTAEIAGRLVSLLAGVALVWGVFLICNRAYGTRVALIGASIVSLHPTLLALSSSVYSEGLYVTLVVFALYWTLRAVNLGGKSDGAIAGVFFGLAYLTRPEAFVLVIPLLFVQLALGFLRGRIRSAALSAGSMLAVFLIVASPYITFLSVNTGELRWEGKGAIIYAISERMETGMGYLEASYGISETLEEEGIHLKTNREVLQSSGMRIADAEGLVSTARYFATSARNNVGDLYRTVADTRPFGAPILPLLVLLGFLGRPWRRSRGVDETVLLTPFLIVLLILLIEEEPDFRHTLSLLPFLIIWGANGIAELADWTTQSIANIAEWQSPWTALSIHGLSVLVVGGIALGSVGSVGEFTQSGFRHLKVAGLWINQRSATDECVMGTGTVIPYYADRSLCYLPFAESTLALRYIAQKNPQFIVLQSRGADRPYMQTWINDGIPHPNARLVYRDTPTNGDTVLVYEWAPSTPSSR